MSGLAAITVAAVLLVPVATMLRGTVPTALIWSTALVTTGARLRGTAGADVPPARHA